MNQEQLNRLMKHLEDKLNELSNENGDFELGEWSAYQYIYKVLWLMTGGSNDSD